MDPTTTALAADLTAVAAKNTASAVYQRVDAKKKAKKDGETIAELEEIISSLIDDRAELIRIAQAYQEELGARRISPGEIEYISETVVPLLLRLSGGSADDSEESTEIIKSLLSVETISVLQLLGFNFREALGEPLTAIAAEYVSSLGPKKSQAKKSTSSGKRRN
ncbi:MAG: hypothetical protein AAF962_27935 [Actinomycetota bacterium]